MRTTKVWTTGIRVGLAVLLGSALPAAGRAQSGLGLYNPPRVPMPKRAAPRDPELPALTVLPGLRDLPRLHATFDNVPESELTARMRAARADEYQDVTLPSGEEARVLKVGLKPSTRIAFYFDPYRFDPNHPEQFRPPRLASLKKDGRIVGVSVSGRLPGDIHEATHSGGLNNPQTLWTWDVPDALRAGTMDLPEDVDGWADTGCQFTLGRERFVPLHIHTDDDTPRPHANFLFLFDAQKGLRWERDLSPLLQDHAQPLHVHSVATLPDGSFTVVTAASAHHAPDTGCRLIVLNAQGQVVSLTDILGVSSATSAATRSGKHFLCALDQQTALLSPHGVPLAVFATPTGTPCASPLSPHNVLTDDHEAVAPTSGLVWRLP